MRIPVQLSLEGEYVRELRKRKVNISGLVNDFLRNVLKSDTVSAEEINLSMLELEKERLVKLAKSYRHQATLIDSNVQVTLEKIKRQKVLIEEIRHSTQIANAIRELNEALLTMPFEVVKGLPVVKTLQDLGIPVDEKWLERQLTRIELLGR